MPERLQEVFSRIAKACWTITLLKPPFYSLWGSCKMPWFLSLKLDLGTVPKQGLVWSSC